MQSGRLEAFSDGVIAIIITIMVLEMKPPHGTDFMDLGPLLPVFLSYLLSFIYIGIYWNNHHHMLQGTHCITGGVLWANLHLLFWLSLVPFATAWMGENHFAKLTVALYGVILLLSAVAYTILQMTLLRAPRGNEILTRALARDWKGKVSIVCYLGAIVLSFFLPIVACSIYAVVAGLWFIPDPRIERELEKIPPEESGK